MKSLRALIARIRRGRLPRVPAYPTDEEVDALPLDIRKDLQLTMHPLVARFEVSSYRKPGEKDFEEAIIRYRMRHPKKSIED